MFSQSHYTRHIFAIYCYVDNTLPNNFSHLSRDFKKTWKTFISANVPESSSKGLLIISPENMHAQIEPYIGAIANNVKHEWCKTIPASVLTIISTSSSCPVLPSKHRSNIWLVLSFKDAEVVRHSFFSSWLDYISGLSAIVNQKSLNRLQLVQLEQCGL